VFARAGGRTELLRQHVAYPFHITRPFYLDAARPDLATLYLQSAAGGVYGGDELRFAAQFGRDSATCITTQSATIVHDSRGCLARQRVQLDLADGAMAVFAPDPLVLFPGAMLESSTEITLGAGASALLQDGFGCHTPAGSAGRFERIALNTTVRDAQGRILVADRGGLDGAMMQLAASPLGRWWACGTTFLLGARRFDPRPLQAALDARGCYAGVGFLPNDAGLFLRLLAGDGGTLARGQQIAFYHGFSALIGHPPAIRRK
jgi:urease accessory protein